MNINRRQFIQAALVPLSAYVERIDESHANARALWREMGEPDYLSASEVARLQETSQIRREPLSWQYADRTVRLLVTLPPHAVAAITVDSAAGESGGGIHT